MEPRPFQRRVQGQLLHGGFGLLPGLLPKGVVLAGVVEMPPQGALGLLFARGGAVADDDGGRPGLEGLPPQLAIFHGSDFLSFAQDLPLVCAVKGNSYIEKNLTTKTALSLEKRGRS